MNHESPEDWIRCRAKLSRQIQGVPVNVSDRVLLTLTGNDFVRLRVDKTPIVLGACLMAIAASIIVALLPSLTVMTEPWISFWLL